MFKTEVPISPNHAWSFQNSTWSIELYDSCSSHTSRINDQKVSYFHGTTEGIRKQRQEERKKRIEPGTCVLDCLSFPHCIPLNSCSMSLRLPDLPTNNFMPSDLVFWVCQLQLWCVHVCIQGNTVYICTSV